MNKRRSIFHYRFGVTTSILAISVAQVAPAEVVVLYDVDFGSPPHVVGQPPAIDIGPVPRFGPSSLHFTQPTVESAVGPLEDQPLQMRVLSGTLCQARFDLGAQTDIPTGFDFYRFEYDALVMSLDWPFDALTLLLDLPIVRNVYLTGSQTIEYFVSGEGGGAILGLFEFGVPVHICVELHVATQRWAISVDGQRLHVGPCPLTEIRSARISLSESNLPLASQAAVDNVRFLGVDHALCPGDLDLDSVVTLQDLATLLAHFGTAGNWLTDGDTDGDSDVDLQDLATLLAEFGQTCP